MTSKVCFFTVCGVLCTAGVALAASPFSQYGNIQNVQNYSSNPFWNPNGPYNQRMPQAVYVQGPDVNTGDCQRTVFALIASECATRNNCVGASLADIRPTIMVQLSRLPGHNYATACAGFIDTSFDEYKSKYANAANMRTTGFPTAVAVNTTTNADNDFTIKNPYEIKTPKWEQDMHAREAELKSAAALGTATFPTTINDYSFTERMVNQADGYEPYKDKSAYVTPEWNVELYDDYLERTKGQPKTQSSTTTAEPQGTTSKKTKDKTPNDFSLIVYNNPNLNVGDMVDLSQNTMPYWAEECSDWQVSSCNVSQHSGVNVAARVKLGSKATYSGNEFGLNYYLQPQSPLTGFVYVCSSQAPAGMPLPIKKEETAKKAAQRLAEGLKAANGVCGNQNLAVYVVSTKDLQDHAANTTEGNGDKLSWWQLATLAVVSKKPSVLSMNSYAAGPMPSLKIVAGPYKID